MAAAADDNLSASASAAKSDGGGQKKLLAALSSSIKALEKGERANVEELLMGRPSKGAAKDKKHDFWSTQPVPQIDLPSDTEHGEIETKTLEQVSKEPYALPANFEWDSVDLTDPNVVNEVYELLAQNYVEDDDNMFRFEYSRPFLEWALKPPGYKRQWHVGVRGQTGKKKLLAFITGVPANMSVYKRQVPMVEINFLCVHKKLRTKRLAPVLIKEITRRVNLEGVWQVFCVMQL